MGTRIEFANDSREEIETGTLRIRKTDDAREVVRILQENGYAVNLKGTND